MAAPMFDDDLFDFGIAADGDDSVELGSAASAGQDDGAMNGAGAADDEPSLGSGRRRKRGSRGGAGSAHEQKWRSGAVSQAPEFSGDVERDPYCLRHYRRRLLRWVKITKEFLPPNEQALRALEKMTGEAELEFEEVSDDRFDHPDGISRLLGDLEKAFGERELFRQGGVIREFESIGRMQGESITAFIRRFRLLERKLAENKVPEYPEQARVIKLLDGLRLDEKSTASVLLAAGNKYNMKSVLEALRIQYPAGMSITGLPKGLSTLSSRSTRSSSSRASTYKSSAAPSSRRSQRPTGRSRWTQWHTEWDGAEDGQALDNVEAYYEEDQGEDHENAEPNNDEEYGDGEEEELIPEEAVQEFDNAETPEDVSALLAAAEALTVTSKKLAGLVQSRGFYVDGKGKGSPFGKSGGKAGGKSGAKGKGKGKTRPARGKGKGTDAKGKGKSGGADRQVRLKGSLCLGCGAADHWIRDCPHVTQFQAQLASADVELDPEGAPVAVSWMVSSTVGAEEESIEVFKVPRPPSIMLSTCEDASFLIADTGCQRQVAGSVWHHQKCSELQPLVPLRFEEVCRFSFGPTSGMPSKGRFLYPAGIGGKVVVLGISDQRGRSTTSWAALKANDGGLGQFRIFWRGLFISRRWRYPRVCT